MNKFTSHWSPAMKEKPLGKLHHGLQTCMYPIPGGGYSGSAVGTVSTSSHTSKVMRKCNGRQVNFPLMIYTFSPNTWKAERQGIPNVRPAWATLGDLVKCVCLQMYAYK